MNPWLSAIATLFVLLTGFTALALGTDGGSVWTAESARRLAVLEQPSPLPPARLQDEKGQARSLTGFKRPVLLLDFIYTNCPSLCHTLGAEFRLLQTELAARGWQERVQLLSLTFDPAHDDGAALTDYLKRFHANPGQWSAARFVADASLESVLKQLGVVVIPEADGGFVHNAAIYMMVDGKVVSIHDLGDPTGILEAVEWQLAAR